MFAYVQIVSLTTELYAHASKPKLYKVNWEMSNLAEFLNILEILSRKYLVDIMS